MEEQEPRSYKALDECPNLDDAEVVVTGVVAMIGDEDDGFGGVEDVADNEGQVEVVEGEDGANVQYWIRDMVGDVSLRRHIGIR